MSIFKTPGVSARLSILVFALFALTADPALAVQQVVPVSFQVKEETQNQVDLLVNASRNVRFDFKISNVFVQNPEVLSATAPSPNEIRITGVKPGVSSLTIENEAGDQQILVVNVTADIRRLEAALKTFFPDCTIKILALNEGVILGGNVAQSDQVEKIIAVAEDYFPTVINQLKVDGPQLVATKVRVYEISRTKARALGIDWGLDFPDFGLTVIPQGSQRSQDANSGVLNSTMEVLVGSGDEFFAIIEALEEHKVARLLDEPTLVTQHGRPARFLSGGELPVLAAAPLGGTYVDWKPFGTQLQVVPMIHGYGQLTLEVNAEVSKPAPELSTPGGNQGIRTRSVNTAVRMRAGHTLILAGNFKEDTAEEKSGIPKLMQSPLWGPLFRKVKSDTIETELVFVITPRFISDIDPVYASKVGVGQLTESPSNHELYINGYVEIPKCQDDCPTTDRFDDPATRYAPQIQPALEEAIHQPSVNLPGSGYLPEPATEPMTRPVEPTPVIVPNSEEDPDAPTDESAASATVPVTRGAAIRYNFKKELADSPDLSGDSK